MESREDRTVHDVRVLVCAECPRVSGFYARGWRAVRVDLPDKGDEPALAFYCPNCAAREFG
jgi:hypothetical protein